MSEVSGKIIVLNETETVGAAGTFKKRLVVIATDEQYSQSVGIDFVQDKTTILDKYKVGDEVKVHVNIRGQEYKGKYYVSLNGWRIEKLEVIGAEPQEAPRQLAVAVEEESDLPF
jgi:hypothetical protein